MLFGSLQLSQLRASAPKLKSNDRTVVSSVSLQLSQLRANAPNVMLLIICPKQTFITKFDPLRHTIDVK